MLVQATNVSDECIDQLRLDRALHEQPAVVGEMRQLIGIGLIDVPGRGEGKQMVGPFRPVGPKCRQRQVGPEGARHHKSPVGYQSC
jgi:hypothetical protein